MDEKLKNYIKNNHALLVQNKIKEFFESVYNDSSLTEEEKAEIFTFANDALQYFNQPNSYNFEYVPVGTKFSGNVYIVKGITAIKEAQFKDCESLQSITIPDSVTEIGKCAFSACGSLQSVNLPKDLSYLGEDVFKDCKSLKEIIIPKSLDPSIYDGRIPKRPRKFV